MVYGDRDHSIHGEPHLRGGAARPDTSEAKAAAALAAEARRAAAAGASAEESVYDEPDILPGRSPEQINQDWCCSKCGYNLRGLMTGDRCPECGNIELYRPPPAGSTSYGERLRSLAAHTSDTRARRTALLIALAGGLLAIPAALFPFHPLLPFATMIPIHVLLSEPILKEITKIGTTAIVLEIAPHRFKRVEQIQVAAIGSAFGFAIIENVIYLSVFASGSSIWLIIFRWTVYIAMHVLCTSIATRGLVSVWQRTMSEGRRPVITRAFPQILIAIILHASFNFAVLIAKYAMR